MTGHAQTMRRKAGQDRPPREVVAPSLPKAFALALSRAGQETLRLPLSTGEATMGEADLAGLPGLLPAGGLTTLLEGRDATRGLIVLDAAILTGVIEVLTTGRVGDAETAERAATQTDAKLARRFLAAVLAGLRAELRTTGDGAEAPAFEAAMPAMPGRGRAAPVTDRPAGLAGFAPGQMVDDKRVLPHLLTDVPYRVFDLAVDLSGRRKGRICLVVPAALLGAHDGGHDAPLAVSRTWEEAFQAGVLGSEAKLEAVLTRLHLPIAKLESLAPGDMLSFPAKALVEVSLEGEHGSVVTLGRLGQSQGWRAVRLNGAAAEHGEGDAATGAARPDGSDYVDAEAGSAVAKAGLVIAP